MVLSFAAVIAGFGLLTAMLLSHTLFANAAKVFLAVLLITGGIVSLWSQRKSKRSQNADSEFLANFLKK
jgi:uncharacterized membrane protein YqjE